MLNKFRYVTGDSDGHNTWQCLKCREMFSASSLYNWKFCPLCGTQWDGEVKWEEKYYPVKFMENPYSWVIQERNIFRHEYGDDMDGWKDTYKVLDAWKWGQYTTSKEVLQAWKNQIEYAQADLNEERKRHEVWCEHSGKWLPFHPFHIVQLRLVLRKKGHPDKIVLKYLESYQGEPSMAWLDG